MSRKTVEQKLADILRKVQEDEEDEEDELDDEHLPFLFRALHSLAPNWYGFSLQLGVSGLDKIQSDGTTVDDCLVLALQRWLKSENTSWKVLVTAIFRPAGGGNQRLAAEVAGSYRELCSFRPRDYASETSTQEICASAGEVSSTVRYIQELLVAKVAPRWYQMGVVLGVQVAELESIRLKNNPAKDSERQMFGAWLENENASLPQTWQVLVDAIGHEAGGNHRKLAKTVSKKVSTQPPGSGATANGRTVSESSTSSAASSLAGSAASSLAGPTSPVVTLPNLDKIPRCRRPDLPTLLNFPTATGNINIAVQVGASYKTFGTLLLDDSAGALVGALEMQYNFRAQPINTDILTKWLQGVNNVVVTWERLVQVLRLTQLNQLATLVENGLTA